MTRTACIAFLALLIAVAAMAQEREYTPYEIQRFELDKHFEATVLLTDGSKLRVTEFHFDTGKYKHKASTGEGDIGMLQPLSNIKRIVRSRISGWVHLIYLNDSEMHTPLRNPIQQRFTGIKEDGSKWIASLDEIAEIEVQEMATPEGK